MKTVSFIVNQAIVDKNYKIAEDYELKIYKDDSLIKNIFLIKRKTTAGIFLMAVKLQ